MKRREIKNLLNAQLDGKTPKLTDKITKTPLGAKSGYSERADAGLEKSAKRSFMPKWAYGVACAVIVCIFALSFGLYFGLPKGESSQPQSVCYVVDINPSIAVTADSNGKVIYLSSQNSEGDIVLSSDTFDDYKEMSVQECVNAIIEQSARLGYIDCQGKDNKVTLTLVGDDRANSTTVKSLAENAQNYLRELNVFAYVDTAKKDVKTFVEDKGWKFNGSRFDNYLDNIRLQSKYVCAAQYGGDFENEAKDYIDGYFAGIVEKRDLLDRLGEKFDEIDELGEITTTYWGYKLVEGTVLAPKLSPAAAKLVNECDALVAKLKELGVNLSGSVEYSLAVAKYTVVEEISKLFEDIQDYIYDSDFFKLFLGLVDEEDVKKFEILENEIESYYNDVVSKLERELNERTSEFLSKFDGRNPISQEEYDKYLSEFRR